MSIACMEFYQFCYLTELVVPQTDNEVVHLRPRGSFDPPSRVVCSVFCIQGFDPVDDSAQYGIRWCSGDGVCIPLYVMGCKPHDTKRQDIILATVLTVSLCMLVLLTYCLCCRRVSKVQRQLRHFKQSLAGMPRSGKMSIVVTDIQGYSGKGRKPQHVCRLFIIVFVIPCHHQGNEEGVGHSWV